MHTGLRRGLGIGAAAACLLGAGIGVADASTPAAQRAAVAADVAAARNQWIGAQELSGGAAQAVPLLLVAADLQRAIRAGADRTTYTREIALVIRFGDLPDAMLTSAQESAFKSDFAAIDRFFGFRKSAWAGGCASHGPGVRAAVRAWSQEPVGPDHGLLKAPLATAAADLARGEMTDAGDRSCYPAAIADLDNLQTATPAQLAASPRFASGSFTAPGSVQIVGAEIVWLNNWFGLESGDSGLDVARLTAPNEY